MAIIYSYPLNDDIKPLDELVGTTQQTINGQLKTVTRNFLLADIAEFLIIDGGIQKTLTLTTNGTSGVSTLDQATGILNIPHYPGDLKVASLFKETFEYTGSNLFPLINTINNVLQVIVNTTSLHPVAYSVELPNIVNVLNELYSGDTITIIYNYLEEVVETPNLQSVTDEGNHTTNNIIIDNIPGEWGSYTASNTLNELGAFQSFTSPTSSPDYQTTYAGYEMSISEIYTPIERKEVLIYSGIVQASYINGSNYNALRLNSGDNSNGPSFYIEKNNINGQLRIDNLIGNTILQFPAKPTGTYTIATTDDVSPNYWTKTGNDIQNNNIGNTQVKILAGKQFQLLNSANTIVGYIDETGIGKFGAGSTYTSFGPAGANIHLNMVRTQMSANFTLGNPQVSQPFSIISTNYFGTSYVAGSAEVSASAVAEHSFNIGNSVGNGITSGIFRISRTRVQSTVPVKYATDLSASYDDRSLVDKGYITTYTTAQLAGKMNNPSLTASYIPKALTATTIGNSQIRDNGINILIKNTELFPNSSYDISLGFDSNKTIAIEDSDNSIIGRSLNINAGRAINFAKSSNFIDTNIIGNSVLLAINLNDNSIYSVNGNNIIKSVENSNIFNIVGTIPTGTISDISIDYINNDVWVITAPATTGNPPNIYKQSLGSGAFVLQTFTGLSNINSNISGLGTISLFINSITKDLFYVAGTTVGGDGFIYKKSSGDTVFLLYNNTITCTSFTKIKVNTSTNDILLFYSGITGSTQYLYKQSSGSGAFNLIFSSGTSGGSVPGIFSFDVSNTNNNVYTISGGQLTNTLSIYKQIGGSGSFILQTFSGTKSVSYNYQSQTSIVIDNKGDVYGSVNSNIIYKQTNFAAGTANLQGGTLKLTSGTGKGTGASDIELYTGQVLASGTDMQTPTLRAKIDNTGLMTLPSVTNALIEADTTGKAVVTKEYLSTSNYWTKTGNDIYNNNTGNIIIGGVTVPNPSLPGKLNIVGNIYTSGKVWSPDAQGFRFSDGESGMYNRATQGLEFVTYGDGTNTLGHYNFTPIYPLGGNPNYVIGTTRCINTSGTYAASSGSVSSRIINIEPTINQTGTANGIIRGLYINPTLTSAYDFRAIEVTVGKVIVPTAVNSNEAVNKGQVDNRLVIETASPYTLTNADSGGIVIFTASTTLTIPTGLADGFECTFVTLSGVTLTVVSTGNTLNNASGSTMAAGLSFTLKRMLAANTYIATGDL